MTALKQSSLFGNPMSPVMVTSRAEAHLATDGQRGPPTRMTTPGQRHNGTVLATVMAGNSIGR